MSEVPLRHVTNILICDSCLDGEGVECHTPGCTFWLCTAPDLDIRSRIIYQGGTIEPGRPMSEQPTDHIDDAGKMVPLPCPWCERVPETVVYPTRPDAPVIRGATSRCICYESTGVPVTAWNRNHPATKRCGTCRHFNYPESQVHSLQVHSLCDMRDGLWHVDDGCTEWEPRDE